MLSTSSGNTAGFSAQPFDAPGYAGVVLRIACPRMQDLAPLGIEELGAALSKVIEEADRHIGADNTTIVVDVIDATVVPPYVDSAIADLLRRHFCAGVIVSCNGGTTHDKSATLPAALCACVKNANRHGIIWHPHLKQAVPARTGIQ